MSYQDSLLAQKLYDDENKYSGGWNFGPIERCQDSKWIMNYDTEFEHKCKLKLIKNQSS